MGMPITLEIVDESASSGDFATARDYFNHIDETFSTYKPTSEISRINNGLPEDQWSREVRDVLRLCQKTKQETNGYFDIELGGQIDPSGLVKGWAIKQAADLLQERGRGNFCLEVGGDIQVAGHNATNQPWRIGLRNPFNEAEIIKTVAVTTEGVATSGTAERGQHIYNPHRPAKLIEEVVSITVIGPDIYQADRFATAAFAMGQRGIEFIESRGDLEAYMVDAEGIATLTSAFERYLVAT